jgi:hypothetical protein
MFSSLVDSHEPEEGVKTLTQWIRATRRPGTLTVQRANAKPIERDRNLSVNAFHEKAGRSQVNFMFMF